jgi:alpha-D-ribose 1-methylphosphonate 5-triphosphate synthase subunit PhnH
MNLNQAVDTITPSSGVVTIAGAVASSSAFIASSATITPTTNTNQYAVTALAVPATIAIPTGTPVDGQKLVIRIEDNGTAQALTWTTSGVNSYRIVGTTLPTTTVISKILYVGCIYNATESFWDVVAVAQQV